MTALPTTTTDASVEAINKQISDLIASVKRVEATAIVVAEDHKKSKKRKAEEDALEATKASINQEIALYGAKLLARFAGKDESKGPGVEAKVLLDKFYAVHYIPTYLIAFEPLLFHSKNRMKTDIVSISAVIFNTRTGETVHSQKSDPMVIEMPLSEVGGCSENMKKYAPIEYAKIISASRSRRTALPDFMNGIVSWRKLLRDKEPNATVNWLCGEDIYDLYIMNATLGHMGCCLLEEYFNKKCNEKEDPVADVLYLNTFASIYKTLVNDDERLNHGWLTGLRIPQSPPIHAFDSQVDARFLSEQFMYYIRAIGRYYECFPDASRALQRD